MKKVIMYEQTTGFLINDIVFHTYLDSQIKLIYKNRHYLFEL